MEKKDLIYFAGIIVILILCAGIITMMKMEVTQCLKNPFLYGAEKMGNIECSCTQYNNKICPAIFSFNGSEFRTPINDCGAGIGLIQKINIDDFEVGG